MKKLILYLALLLPMPVIAQSSFIGLTGTIIRNSTSATYTNSSTADQVLFSSTIAGGSMTVDRPYYFLCDMTVTIPTLSIPTISFDIKLGTGNTLVFVSGAGLVTGVTNGYLGITGYLVKKANGTVLVKFSITPTGNNSTINLSTSNTIQVATWTIDTTVDQAFSVNVAFGGITTSNTTLTRQMVIRSDF